MNSNLKIKLWLLFNFIIAVKGFSQWNPMPDKWCYTSNFFSGVYNPPFYFLTDSGTIFRYSSLGGNSPQLTISYYLCKSTDDNASSSQFVNGLGGLECCSSKEIVPIHQNKVVYSQISLLNTKFIQKTNNTTSTVFSVVGWENNFSATLNNVYCVWKKYTFSRTYLFLNRSISNTTFSDTLKYKNIKDVPKIHFVNDSTGYIYGKDTLNNNTIIRTGDYGNTWNKVLNPSNDITDIKFQGDTGYAVGYGGIIYQSIDNGLNWNSLTSFTSNKLNSVSVSNSTCFVAGDNATLFYSNNTGVNWVQDTAGIITNIDWVKITANNGIYFQSKNRLFKKGYFTFVSEINKVNTNFVIYPNPANDLIHIKFLENNTGKYKISIFNILGEIVSISEEKDQIDISELTSGIYSLEIYTSKKETYRSTFVKVD